MKITSVSTVTSEEIFNEWNIRVFDCCFVECVENDSYVVLDLSEDRVDELKEDIEWQTGKGDSVYLRRLKNELNLVENFRSIGYTTSILVYVSW
jgi:hypothetical protein